MTSDNEEEYKNETLKKEGEKAVTRLILLGAIALLLTVIVIGFLLRNSMVYK